MDVQHGVAIESRLQLFEKLTQAKFFSLLMNGSTGKGNADDEVFMAVWCESTSTDEKHVCRPNSVDAHELFHSLSSVLFRPGISDIDAESCKKNLLLLEVTVCQPILLKGIFKGLLNHSVSGCFEGGDWRIDWNWLHSKIQPLMPLIMCSSSCTTCTRKCPKNAENWGKLSQI